MRASLNQCASQSFARCSNLAELNFVICKFYFFLKVAKIVFKLPKITFIFWHSLGSPLPNSYVESVNKTASWRIRPLQSVR
jgi:hypothetical protein